jgi:hypothetical protein
VGTISAPQLGHSKAWHSGAAELALGMDNGYLLLKGHTTHEVGDTLLNVATLIKIGGRLSRGHKGAQHNAEGEKQLFHNNGMKATVCPYKKLKEIARNSSEIDVCRHANISVKISDNFFQFISRYIFLLAICSAVQTRGTP